VPDEEEQDDDRNRNAEQPEKYASSHKSSPFVVKTTAQAVLRSGIEAVREAKARPSSGAMGGVGS
jgi:hypothetical protein